MLVGEATRRATEAAIAYEDGGEHELKGKTEPLPLCTARSASLAARGGAQKSAGLEPPFVGRDRRAAPDQGALPQLGGRGQGAARLGRRHRRASGSRGFAWEFEKYVDGLADHVLVAPRPLPRVRRGCRVLGARRDGAHAGGDPRGGGARAPRSRSSAPSIEEHVSDDEERAWLEPRLAHLLGLPSGPPPTARTSSPPGGSSSSGSPSSGRSSWSSRTCSGPTLGCSTSSSTCSSGRVTTPLFVLALARPELLERRPTFGAAAATRRRSRSSRSPSGAMEELLDGFVPGLPDELRGQILERAEGVPALRRRDGAHAARPGAARAGRRRLPTDRARSRRSTCPRRCTRSSPRGSTVSRPRSAGCSRTPPCSASRSRRRAWPRSRALSEPELEPVLASLVRKEVLSVQADPRSPERGQYSFLQDLLKRVAYETLAKPSARHATSPRPRTWSQAFGAGEQEIVEVIAAHYLDAYRAAPDADDAAEIKAKALEMLTRAGERAASLAANEEAQHYFERAAELADDPLAEAGLLERAGATAWVGRASGGGTRTVRARARALRDRGPDSPRRADLGASGRGRLAERPSRGGARADGAGLRGARQATSRTRTWRRSPPSSDGSTSSRARSSWPRARVDTAIEIAESLWLPEVLSQAPEHAGPDHGLRRALGAVARAVQARARARARARPHRRCPARLQQPRRSARPAGPVRGGDRAAAARARARAQGRLPRKRVAADRGAERLPVPDRPVGRGAGARSGGSRGTAQPDRDCRRQHADFGGRRAR